mmetsp:Transcript_33948/g.66271  ORF Transcript_33948/g.66271 Transcript_33948/m.66271 type:complete len:211 (-) Transcript_33948:22-654(-)
MKQANLARAADRRDSRRSCAVKLSIHLCHLNKPPVSYRSLHLFPPDKIEARTVHLALCGGAACVADCERKVVRELLKKASDQCCLAHAVGAREDQSRGEDGVSGVREAACDALCIGAEVEGLAGFAEAGSKPRDLSVAVYVDVAGVLDLVRRLGLSFYRPLLVPTCSSELVLLLGIDIFQGGYFVHELRPLALKLFDDLLGRGQVDVLAE